MPTRICPIQVGRNQEQVLVTGLELSGTKQHRSSFPEILVTDLSRTGCIQLFLLVEILYQLNVTLIEMDTCAEAVGKEPHTNWN